MKEHN